MIRNEPVIVRAAVGLLATVAAQYGLDLSEDQLLAVYGVIMTLVAVWTRSKVSPVD